MHAKRSPQLWEKRLYLPAYQVKAAASYAGVTPQTVRNWQRSSEVGAVLAPRSAGEALSYLQLQELAIVSAMRKLGVKLSTIRCARDYLSSLLKAEFPFADERVKSDGQDVLVPLAEGLKSGESKVLMVANKNGQYAWSDIIGERFEQFEYEKGIALKWHLSGDGSVVIDPRVAFGAPTVRGVPTWALWGRVVAGEMPEEIAEDFGMELEEVQAALAFEKTLH
jgi:uncharacterized protein (DUF433 family)